MTGSISDARQFRIHLGEVGSENAEAIRGL